MLPWWRSHMLTVTDYEVRFTLEGDERIVVPGRRPHTYVRVEYVMVNLHGDTDRVRVFVSGYRCRRDGGQDRRGGRSIESVDLPESDVTEWVRRAWGVVTSRDTAIEAERRAMMLARLAPIT